MFNQPGGDYAKRSADAHNNLVRKFHELAKSHRQHLVQSEIEQLHDLNKAIYAESARYASVLMVAGYAAFFTMWASMRELLAPIPRLWAAIFMLFSIIVFFTFEFLKMVTNVIEHRRVMAAADEVKPHPTPSMLKAVREEQSRKFSSRWAQFLVPGAISGFAAGLILLSAFVESLIREYAA